MLSTGMTEQQLDPGAVVYARIEEHILEQQFLQRRQLYVLSKAAIATPVVGYRAPPRAG